VAGDGDQSIPVTGWSEEKLRLAYFPGARHDLAWFIRNSCAMMLRSICWCFLIVASNSQSATLYKCSGPKKDAISIQSEPCPNASKQIWMREATPEPPPTSEQLRARETKRRQDADDARALSRLAGTATTSNRVLYRQASTKDAARLRCDRAKQEAMAIRDRDWRNMNVDRLRRLDAWVEAECKSRY
jgi:hypothetical protein